MKYALFLMALMFGTGQAALAHSSMSKIAPVPANGSGFKNSFSMQVPALAHGHYSVNWTAVAKDGHVMKGQPKFQVSE